MAVLSRGIFAGLGPKYIRITVRFLAAALPAAILIWLIGLLFRENGAYRDEALLAPSVQQKAVRNPEAPLEFQSSFFRLNQIPIVYKMPDLRSIVLYHGTNLRPDLSQKEMQVLFSLRGSPAVYAIKPQESAQLMYEGKIGSGRWSAICGRDAEAKSGLFLSITPKDSGAAVSIDVRMPEGQNSSLESTRELKEFTVAATPSPAHQAAAGKWTLGEYAVDAGLFEKQSAVWFGRDAVIEQLGDGSWEYQKGRERIQLESPEGRYTLWAKEGDAFIFEEDRWIPQEIGPATRGRPLLLIGPVQERSLAATLWNEDGSRHISLQIPKKDAGHSMNGQPPGTTPFDIKIIGMKSRNKWIAEVNGVRMTLEAYDWLLLPAGEKRPIVIDSTELLQEYLEGDLTGWLLAFQGTRRIDAEQCLTAILFNPARSSSSPVHTSLYRSWERQPQRPQSQSARVDDDEIDEDDDIEEMFLDDEESDTFEDEFDDA